MPAGVAGTKRSLPCTSSPDVGGVQAVHVLVGIERLYHRVDVDVVGQRELDEQTVDLVVLTKLAHLLDDLVLGRRAGHTHVARQHPGLRGRLLLAANIDRRGGVVAHEDDGEAGRDAVARLEIGHLAGDLSPHVGSDFLAVDQFRLQMLSFRRAASGSAQM